LQDVVQRPTLSQFLGKFAGCKVGVPKIYSTTFFHLLTVSSFFWPSVYFVSRILCFVSHMQFRILDFSFATVIIKK